MFKWEPQHQKAFEEIKADLINPPVLLRPLRDKVMKLYIAASDNTIGSMLSLEDENGVEKTIYYLKQYIKPIDVYVYSHFDIIKHMLSKPILHNKVGKWALALTEYSLTY